MDLSADYKLSALIAEKIMNCNVEQRPIAGVPGNPMLAYCGCPGAPHALSEDILLKEYSMDIGAAWEVIKKLQETFYELSIEVGGSSEYPDEWQCVIGWTDGPTGDRRGPWYVVAPTAPEAICLAALKTIRS